MAHQITVTTTTMKNKANELKSLNNKFKNQISSLRSSESSLNSMWDGEANDAFHKAFNNDMIQLNNFFNAIEQYIAKLNQIAQAYDKAEKTNVSTANTRKYK